MGRKTIATMVAAPVPITIRGKEYRFTPLTGDNLGELEAWLREQPLERLRERFERFPELFTPEMREKLVLDAMNAADSFSLEDVEHAKHLHSVAGLGYILWMGLRDSLCKDYPNMTRADVFGLVELADLADLKATIDRVSGLAGKKGGGRGKPAGGAAARG